MSLLDRDAPHTVYVQLREMQRDEGGRRVLANVGEPIPVRCGVQIARDWSSAEEKLENGLQVYNMRVIYSRTWPGDEHSHIIIDGELYEMIGAPQRTAMSRRTAHWRNSVRHIGTAPAP